MQPRVQHDQEVFSRGKGSAAPAGAEENPLREIADELYAEYDKCMGQVDFTNAAAAVQKLASRVNLYVEDSAPWNLAKSEETADELAAVIYNALEAIRIIALYMAPFMPNTSAEVFNRLGLGDIFAITDIEAATVWGSARQALPLLWAIRSILVWMLTPSIFPSNSRKRPLS